MSLRIIAVTWLLIAFACGGSTPDEQARPTEPEPPAPVPAQPTPQPPPTPPTPPPVVPPAARAVKVRVFHAAAAQSKAPIAVRIGADETAAAPEYGVAATDVEARTVLATATNEQVVELRVADQVTRTHALGNEEHISVFLLTPWTVDGTRPGISVASAPDRTDAPPAGTIRVRFMNALIGEESIDVCPDPEGRDPVFPYVHYGVVDGMHSEDVPPRTVRYVEVPTASLPRWTIRVGHMDAPCRSTPFGSFTLPRTLDAQNVTLVWIGNTRGTPRRQLLACTDPPGASTCVAVPLRR